MTQDVNVTAADRVIHALMQEIARASQGANAWWERDQAVIATRKYKADGDAQRCIARLSKLLEDIESPIDLSKIWD